jgi:hypothetical protein
MKTENTIFGHLVEWSPKEKRWFFLDNGEPYNSSTFERECPKCGMHRTVEGHDPCLGTLPGVRFACCGHGVTDGYISFESGVAIYGDFTSILYWNEHGYSTTREAA